MGKISVKNEQVLLRIKEESNIVHAMYMNCFLNTFFEEKVEMTGRRGRRHKLILNDLAEAIGYWKLKEEAPDRNLWRNRFGGGCGPVVRQTTQ
jgi:hypothetical protein